MGAGLPSSVRALQPNRSNRARQGNSPPFRDPVDTNVLVHALRLWGPHARFSEPAVPDGDEMLNFFLDDAHFRRLAGDQAPPER